MDANNFFQSLYDKSMLKWPKSFDFTTSQLCTLTDSSHFASIIYYMKNH